MTAFQRRGYPARRTALRGARYSFLFALAVMTTLPARAMAPDFDTVRAAWRSSEARLLDRHGQPLAELRLDFSERRLDWVDARTLSPPLVRALLVAEDKRFLEHSGVDWTALAGATWDNIWRTLEGRRPRGASTLTMQLAGLIDPALSLQGKRRSVGQKWDQAAAARDIERRWNKAQILEAYFNLAPFRGELRGISAASHGLFGKDPGSIDAREAVVLAALLRGPNAPPERVARRACAVAKRLSPPPPCEALQALAERTLSQRYRLEPRWQDALPLARRLLRTPGERRTTTLDVRLQKKTLDALGSARRDAAAIVLDNLTGEALAWVGGEDNDAVVRRLPAGSAIQPFLYGLALEQRWISAASVLDDSPTLLALPARPAAGEGSGRLLSVRSALSRSAEFPALRLRAMVGDEALAQRLRQLELESSAGSVRAALPDLANAYRALANEGLWSPWLLEPVSSPSEGAGSERRVWSPAVAWLIGDLLSSRSSQANGGERRLGFARAHGRSSDGGTHWTIGWTRRYTIAVRGSQPIEGLWQSVAQAVDPLPQEGLPPPAGLERTRVHFEPDIEPERDEFFLPGTRQAFVDATHDLPDGRPRIVLPAPGVKLVSAAIPGGRQPLLFEARPPQPGLVWHINGERVPAVEGRALWAPRPGRHRLVLEDATGLQIEATEFEIRLEHPTADTLSALPAPRTPPGPTPASR
ncbi:transglycosylase domain-containing protein [Methyloversatilis thermotolerans]|uniref:transglycosylase domain-containing protein n=1 Tax=Methyloversatilis thermotolerans TaxID=1346290 RepID=UPI0003647A1A|nr:transglycosylase domain-containing protein [Methyloversatilis thermotolerans]